MRLAAIPLAAGLAVRALLAVALAAAAQDWARERLEKSPRHQEWVTVKRGDRTVHAFLVFPEVKAKAPAVVVIHENRGLTHWVRTVADRQAEAGVIAIAPDLLSGAAPGGGKTGDFSNQDAAREAISKLSPDEVTADLAAVADYVGLFADIYSDDSFRNQSTTAAEAATSGDEKMSSRSRPRLWMVFFPVACFSPVEWRIDRA